MADEQLCKLGQVGKTTTIAGFIAVGRGSERAPAAYVADPEDADLICQSVNSHQALLDACKLVAASGYLSREHEGRQIVDLTNDHWVFAELFAAIADAEGDHETA